MKQNVSLLLFVIFVLALTSFNLVFAEDEHVSEGSEHTSENNAEHSTEHDAEHTDAVEEEHTSHEEHEEKEPEHSHIHEVGEGPHVHNSLTAETAKWVGVGTLVATVPVFAITTRSANKIHYKNVILTLSIGVGILHILLTPDHWIDVNITHAVFFAVLGSAQIAYGLLFMVKPISKLAAVGIVGNTGSIILYFVTRIQNLPEPFGAPEGIDAVGIIAKIVEISLVALLIYLIAYYRKISPLTIKD